MTDPTASVPETFDEARPLLRLRPLGADPLAVRRTMVVNAGGTPQDADAAKPVAAELLVGVYLDLPTADVPVTRTPGWSRGPRWCSVTTAGHRST